MKMRRSLRPSVAAVLVLALGPAGAQEPPEFSFESLSPPVAVDTGRVRALAGAMRFETWPRPSELALAPLAQVNRSLLSRPGLVARETSSVHTVRFGGEEWGVARIAWQSFSQADPAAPQELPRESREDLLRRLTPSQRADPATVERYLARQERLRAGRMQRLTGEMTFEIALAPSARAAQDYLLARIAENMLPTDVLAATYRAAASPVGLGDKGWLTESRSKESVRVELVRRNVVLAVTARGPFAEEALQIARRLDGLVERQPPLTPEGLRARRPVVTIHHEPGARVLRYSVSAPEGVDVAGDFVRMDGRTVKPRDRAVSVAGAAAREQVGVSVVTRELLVGTAQADLR